MRFILHIGGFEHLYFGTASDLRNCCAHVGDHYVDLLIYICVLLTNMKIIVNPIRKHAYSNILEILQPKNENFQIKNSDVCHISAQKNRL